MSPNVWYPNRYVERLRQHKLKGGKQDIAGTQEDHPRTKDWIVELSVASRALALRWVRAAREGLDGKQSRLFLDISFFLAGVTSPSSRICPRKSALRHEHHHWQLYQEGTASFIV